MAAAASRILIDASMARRGGGFTYLVNLLPRLAPCPVIASFRIPNVFTTLDQGWYAFQVFRLGAMRQLARVMARSGAPLFDELVEQRAATQTR